MRKWMIRENIYSWHLEYELNVLSESGWNIFSINTWTSLYTIIAYKDE